MTCTLLATTLTCAPIGFHSSWIGSDGLEPVRHQVSSGAPHADSRPRRAGPEPLEVVLEADSMGVRSIAGGIAPAAVAAGEAGPGGTG